MRIRAWEGSWHRMRETVSFSRASLNELKNYLDKNTIYYASDVASGCQFASLAGLAVVPVIFGFIVTFSDSYFVSFVTIAGSMFVATTNIRLRIRLRVGRAPWITVLDPWPSTGSNFIFGGGVLARLGRRGRSALGPAPPAPSPAPSVRSR